MRQFKKLIVFSLVLILTVSSVISSYSIPVRADTRMNSSLRKTEISLYRQLMHVEFMKILINLMLQRLACTNKSYADTKNKAGSRCGI